ncbi:uncharacterized protein HGUI_00869 [Hanseniaspora guilliermondii]|uniref:Tyrosine-protein phosphatase 3 n=1 Tax=Hanseniaspora guilliermondii TaxID=56406 RepID=A0A1L0CIR3_9ASCO|nr:uncharacterized protein HGUI_00869 [Hanseniaspora guilliermondii]
MPESIRSSSKNKPSLKQRRSFNSDLMLDMSFNKTKANIFASHNENTSFFGNTPGYIHSKNDPVNTPYTLDNNSTGVFHTGRHTSNDAIMECEEESDNKAIINFEHQLRRSPKKESVQSFLLQESESCTSISDDSEIQTNRSSDCSVNTTPMNVKFKFGDSKTNNELGTYDTNLENHKKLFIEGSNMPNQDFNLKLPKMTRPSLNNRDTSGLIMNTHTGNMHKYSNSYGNNKSKSSKKHRHNLSLPQAHMMTFKNKNNTSNGNVTNREFGENFFKINVEYQETLSPLIESVNIEEEKRLCEAKKVAENNKHQNGDDLEFFYTNSTETFFQRHYKHFKRALQNPMDNAYKQVAIPKWLDHLLLQKEKVYFVRKFQQLSYLERERIDQYFLYQKRLFESNNTENSTFMDDMANSQLFSGDVFENGIKNRYKSVIPYHKTRVILHENAKRNKQKWGHESDKEKGISNTSSDTYFNGNYLSTPFKTKDNPSGLCPYIATQAPLDHTIRDFYNVLISNKVNLVITLTREIENGMNKCSNFWVDGKDYDGIKCSLLDEFSMSNEHMKHCIFQQEVRKAEVKRYKQDDDYFSSKIYHDIEESLIIRLMKLEWIDVETLQERQWIFVQIQMTTWPDFSIPKCNCDVLNILNIKMLLQNICDQVKMEANDEHIHTHNKVVVHCSSGSGRSGTICCTDALIDIIQHGNEQLITTEDPVYDIVATFREQRLHMVQNVNQYMMIYDCLVSYTQSIADGSWVMYREKFENLDIFRNFKQLISSS